jgi:hypothetical protein
MKVWGWFEKSSKPTIPTMYVIQAKVLEILDLASQEHTVLNVHFH